MSNYNVLDFKQELWHHAPPYVETFEAKTFIKSEFICRGRGSFGEPSANHCFGILNLIISKFFSIFHTCRFGIGMKIYCRVYGETVGYYFIKEKYYRIILIQKMLNVYLYDCKVRYQHLLQV